MANKKITELFPVATMTSTDVIPIVTDVSTVPVTKKISGLNLATFFRNIFKNEYVNADGWIPANETWTYVSANSFSISGNVTYKYQKGDKLKLGQSGTKYFYVTDVTYSAPNTIVTVTGGSDYTLANAGISLNYFSKVENPYGFPASFNYAVSWTASVTNPAIVNGTLNGRFKVRGNFCLVQIYLIYGTSTTSGSGDWRFSIPLAVSSLAAPRAIGIADVRDASINNYVRMCILDSSATYITTFKQLDSATNLNSLTGTSPITFGNGDSVAIQIEYEI